MSWPSSSSSSSSPVFGSGADVFSLKYQSNHPIASNQGQAEQELSLLKRDLERCIDWTALADAKFVTAG